MLFNYKHLIYNPHELVCVPLFIPLQVPKNIPIYYQIKLKQVLPVKNLQPAVIKVYDYYQTSKTWYANVVCLNVIMSSVYSLVISNIFSVISFWSSSLCIANTQLLVLLWLHLKVYYTSIYTQFLAYCDYVHFWVITFLHFLQVISLRANTLSPVNKLQYCSLDKVQNECIILFIVILYVQLLCSLYLTIKEIKICYFMKGLKFFFLFALVAHGPVPTPS